MIPIPVLASSIPAVVAVAVGEVVVRLGSMRVALSITGCTTSIGVEAGTKWEAGTRAVGEFLFVYKLSEHCRSELQAPWTERISLRLRSFPACFKKRAKTHLKLALERHKV
jgi:hypothetical protein